MLTLFIETVKYLNQICLKLEWWTLPSTENTLITFLPFNIVLAWSCMDEMLLVNETTVLCKLYHNC